MVGLTPWTWRLLVVAAGLFSLGALLLLATPRGRWGRTLRKGLLGGVPWGTILTVGVVLAVYLFVQGGWANWNDPLVVSFRAWSYHYPIGVLFAGLAHAGPGHLVGNLLGTVVFGSLAEYAWGHFPRGRGDSSFASPGTNPFVRVLAFPLAAVVVAVLGAAFGLGPVIGFSGVVFAFAGFALVRFPVATVAVVVGSNVINQLYRAVESPTVPGSGGVTYSSPWWAEIAIQGHALGLFLGIAAGVFLVHHREDAPSAGRVWFAALAFGASKGLWAVYAYVDGGYVLLRALGVSLLFLLATLVTAAAVTSRRELVPAIGLSRREAAVGLLLAVTLALALVAVPYNLLSFASADVPGSAVEAGDYSVYYAENVQNRLVSAYDVPFYDTSNVSASGVIVTSERRGIWWEAVNEGELAFRGRASVSVGGLGWEETVVANRTGWTTVGGPTTYTVALGRAGGPFRTAYAADSATAEPTVAGRNVTISPDDEGGFRVIVSRGNDTTLDGARLPAVNESVTVGGLTLDRVGQKLFAARNDTRVRVAAKERYRSRSG